MLDLGSNGATCGPVRYQFITTITYISTFLTFILMTSKNLYFFLNNYYLSDNNETQQSKPEQQEPEEQEHETITPRNAEKFLNANGLSLSGNPLSLWDESFFQNSGEKW